MFVVGFRGQPAEKMKSEGALIVIEGVDSVGKSTQSKMLEDHFKSRGLQVVSFDFPNYQRSPFGKILGRFLVGEFGNPVTMDPFETALLYAGDRLHFRSQLQQALADGAIVLLNRYVPSNEVYGCAKLRLLDRADERSKLRSFTKELEYTQLKLPRPDLVIVLDASPTTTERNMLTRAADGTRSYLENGGAGSADAYEESAMLQHYVREEYQAAVADNDQECWRLVNVDGGSSIRSKEAIHNDVVKCVQQELKHIFA